MKQIVIHRKKAIVCLALMILVSFLLLHTASALIGTSKNFNAGNLTYTCYSEVAISWYATPGQYMAIGCGHVQTVGNFYAEVGYIGVEGDLYQYYGQNQYSNIASSGLIFNNVITNNWSSTASYPRVSGVNYRGGGYIEALDPTTGLFVSETPYMTAPITG